MDALLDRITFAPISDVAVQSLLQAGMRQFYTFTLVLVRLSGLMTIGPVFGQSLVPANVRILLVLSLSMLVTPLLARQPQIAFQKLDANRDGLLERQELPEHLHQRFDELLARAGKPKNGALLPREFYYSTRLPRTIVDYAWVGVGEFALGLVLGLGVLIILSGMQLAGEIIDQQTGIALGEVSSPGLEINGSITGQFLFLLATTLLLLMKPLGFHLILVSAMLETFQTIPVGDAFVSVPAIELIRDLVHQSLVLGVQVAAPVLATMSLVALTMGFLGHTVPQINVLVVGFPIRALVSLLVLAASLSGVARAVVDAVPRVIDEIRHILTAL